MNGYFNGLIRMTGISFGRDNPIQRPVSTGIDTPQPLHVEETHVAEAPAPAPRQAQAPAPTDVEETHVVEALAPAPGQAQAPAPTEIPPSIPAPISVPLIPDRVDVKDQPGTSRDNAGVVTSLKSIETEPGSPGTFPLERVHTRTVTGNRSSGTNISPPGSAQATERSKNRSIQPDNGYGQVNAVEEEKEVIYPARPGAVEPHLVKTGKPGQTGTEHVIDTIVEIVPHEKGKKEKIVTGKAAAAGPQTGDGLAVEDVLRWVAESPLKVDATVKEKDQSPPPKTVLSQAALLQDNREFNLSIGTISITVEEPQTRVDVMKNPPTQPSPDSGRDRNVSIEVPSSRLGRHYLRMRG